MQQMSNLSENNITNNKDTGSMADDMNINTLNTTHTTTNNNNHPMNMDVQSADDTPMALLEQLVYIDNFFQQSDSPSAQSTDNFDDQLQRELAAFANDTFIFPDEDKPRQASSNGNNNTNTNNNNNNQNQNQNQNQNSPNNSTNLLSFSQASFNHLSPVDASPVSSSIPQTHYQNLSQRYNNSKQKFTYQESMSQHMSIIPSTINELLGKRSTPTNYNDNNNNNNNNNLNTPSNDTNNNSRSNTEIFRRSNSSNTTISNNNSSTINNNSSTINNNSNNITVKNRKIQVPQGAQSTLAAAGLSQTQIDALASLVAYHNPSLDKSQAATPNSNINDSTINPRRFSQTSQNSQTSQTSQNFQLLHALSQPQQPQLPLQQQQQNIPNNNNVTNLLVNLFAQTLATAIGTPQQQQQQQQLQSQSQNLAGLLRSNTPLNGLQNNDNILSTLLQLQLQQQQQSQLQQPPQPQNLNSRSLLANSLQTTSHTLSNSPIIPVDNPSSSSTQSHSSTPLSTTTTNNKKTTLTFKNSLLDISKNSNEPTVRKSTSSFNKNSNSTSKDSLNEKALNNANNLNKEKVDPTNNRSSDSLDMINNNTNNLTLTTTTTTSSTAETSKTSKGTASVRFRQKKKLKEQEMEKNLLEAKEVVESLQARINQLEMENRLLRDLVVEKSHQRDSDEVERLRKKARMHVKNEK